MISRYNCKIYIY